MHYSTDTKHSSTLFYRHEWGKNNEKFAGPTLMNHTLLAYIQDSAFIIIISYFCIKAQR